MELGSYILGYVQTAQAMAEEARDAAQQAEAERGQQRIWELERLTFQQTHEVHVRWAEHAALQQQRIQELERELAISNIVTRGQENAIDDSHQGLANEKRAHANTKRVTTRKINKLKRECGQ